MTLASRQNAAYSLVATAPSTPTGGLSLVVTAGEGARFSGMSTPFYATVWAAGAQPLWAAGGATAGNFEIVQVTAVATDTLTIVRAQEGTTARTILIGDQIAVTFTAQTFRNAQNLPRSARASNTILGVADGGSAVCATAAFTQTLTAAATLGAGWWVIVKNDTTDGTTVLVLDPNAAETIDGLTTATMYSGETRLIECDGSNFTSQLIHGGYAKFTPGSSSFVVPAGIEELDVVCVGSGGQGGGGFSGSAAANLSGGAGGGGGCVTRAIMRGSDFTAGATVTVTVGAGGSAAGAAGSPGSNGTDGSATTFGTFLKAGGGGGGVAGQTGANAGSGGGGTAVNSAVGITAATPSSGASPIAMQSGTSQTTSAGIGTEWGGASGGGGAQNTGGSKAGGGSIYGGPGGASGGGTSTTTGGNGAAGGNTQSYGTGGGASGGTGGSSTTKGSDGTFTGPFCGTGGGGGGSGSTGVTGKAGGIGGIGAGGGGGGSSANTTGGAGGAGGAGECRIWYS